MDNAPRLKPLGLPCRGGASDGHPAAQGQYDIGVVEREKGAEIAKRVRPADAA